MPNSAAEPGGSHRRAIVNYRIRTGAFAYCFGVLGVHAWENNFGPGYWGALVLLFLVYPHVAFLRARYSTDSKRAEEKNLYVDSVMLGAWLTSMQFPMWPLYAALFATTLNATVLSGLRGTEERYRLIAENAADLIALVDRDGRWIYTSPSYDQVFDKADLEPGIDAFRRAHPDDAERAQLALARAAALGKPREVALRLVDRSGRIRQYRTLVQAVGPGKPASRLLLSSQDVTDLRESEERLLLATNAIEGMTEASLAPKP